MKVQATAALVALGRYLTRTRPVATVRRRALGSPAALGLSVLLAAALQSGCCALGGCAPDSLFPSARLALDAVAEQHRCSRALRGQAKLDYFDDQGRVRVETLFLAEHPDHVRFDLISPFGGTLATLTADGETFALLDTKDKAFYLGPASQCNVERFLRVPVPPAALIQLMAGEAPVLVHQPGQASIEWSGGRYQIEIESRHGASQVIELVPHDDDWYKPYTEQRLRVVAVAVEQQGVELYRAELKDHAPAATAKPRVDPLGIDEDVPPSGPQCYAEIPRRVRFIVPLSDRDVIFEHDDVEHNPPLLPGTFTQPVPDGVSVRRSDCM